MADPIILIATAGAAFTGALAITTFNRLVRLKEDAVSGKKNIDVELDRRAKILDSLATAAKRYLQHENDTFRQVAELRAGAQEARDHGKQHLQAHLEAGISQLLPQLRVVVESYPQLRGDATIASLMEEVTTTENRLGFAKSFYNSAAREFNEAHKRFPANLLVALFFQSFRADLPYWEVEESVRAQLEASRLSL